MRSYSFGYRLSYFLCHVTRSIFDAEDSFPTGAIRKKGRVFMHPDIHNIQQLDGDLFDVKYLIILRNTTVCIFIIFYPLIMGTSGYSFIRVAKKFCFDY